MYGDRSTSWNHTTPAAAAATSGRYLAASGASANVTPLQPHHVFDQSDLSFRRQTTVSTAPEVDQAPGGARYFAGAYGDILAASSSGEPFTTPAAGPTMAFLHRSKCLNSFCMPFSPVVFGLSYCYTVRSASCIIMSSVRPSVRPSVCLSHCLSARLYIVALRVGVEGTVVFLAGNFLLTSLYTFTVE